jgi:hypothetical protein
VLLVLYSAHRLLLPPVAAIYLALYVCLNAGVHAVSPATDCCTPAVLLMPVLGCCLAPARPSLPLRLVLLLLLLLLLLACLPREAAARLRAADGLLVLPCGLLPHAWQLALATLACFTVPSGRAFPTTPQPSFGWPQTPMRVCAGKGRAAGGQSAPAEGASGSARTRTD